jgi:hypothetical protein
MSFDYFVIEPFTISVNYDLSLEEMIRAGKYNRIDTSIKEKVAPLKKTGTIETELNLIRFGSNMSNAKIFKMFEKYNLRPANIHELLAFGAKYPNKQKIRPIVAIGLIWHISLGNIILTSSGRFQILSTLISTKFVTKWPYYVKFLAACK